MQHSLRALLLTTSLLAAAPAWADAVYNLGKVIITGNKSVTTDKLMAVVKERPGTKITVSDIQADLNAIAQVLKNADVVGGLTPSVRTEGNVSDVIFTINDQGVQAPTVTTVAPKLDAEIFDGNASVPSATLAVASGLNPGDDLSNAKLVAAEQAIVTAYKSAKVSVSVQINDENKRLANGNYDVIWHIVETKAAAPAKKKDTSDTGGVSE